MGDPAEARYGPLAAWVTRPAGAFNGLGVVIVPPIGYDYSSSLRALHVLARKLAERGCLVVRVDPFGIGDSAGTASEVHSSRVWDNVVGEAAGYLRDCGAHALVLVGCGMGGTLALVAAEAVGASAVVALAPVTLGRHYVRGLKLMSIEHDEDGIGLVVAGTEFPESLLADLAAIDLTQGPLLPCPCLVVARPQRSSAEAKFHDRLVANGTKSELWLSAALESFLDTGVGKPTIDATFLAEVADWACGSSPSSADGCRGGGGPGRPGMSLAALREGTAQVAWGNGLVCERFVTVGPHRLVGVLTTPPDLAAPAGNLVVLLNTELEPHTGPGRAWVEVSRALATRGVSAVRVDMRGWGNSPDRPGGECVLSLAYDFHSLEDARSLAEAFSREGWSRVVLAGLCASGWLAVHTGSDTKVGGVLAIDAHLQHQFGDPLFATAAEAWAWRNTSMDDIKREAIAGRWDREDEEGMRLPAARLLDSLVDDRVPCSLIFSAADSGYDFLVYRLGRRLAAAEASGYVRIHKLPEMDHALHRAWLWPKLVELFLAELDRWAELA